MSKDSKPTNWVPISQNDAKALTGATNSPGLVIPLQTSQLPEQLKKIAGVSSFYISGNLTQHAIDHGVTIGGQMLVARVDGATTKNYIYVLGTSSNGQVYFNGNAYKGFGHHVKPGEHVEVSSLFLDSSFTNKPR